MAVCVPESSPNSRHGDGVDRNLMQDRTLIFARLYGVALVAHVVGNWAQPDLPAPVGWANLVVGILGLWLSIRPEWLIMVASGAAVAFSVVLEMPMTGNHWVLAALVGAAILVTRSEGRLVTAARWILLVFYTFAAFAKLNAGFFDPSVSCAVFYANQSLGGYGLPPIDSSSPMALIVIWGTVAIECSIPVLLVLKRTRYLGVLVGSTFHTLLSLDLNQHFYDFTAVLLALFFLFVPDESVDLIAAGAQSLSSAYRRFVIAWWVSLGGALVVLAVTPQSLLASILLSIVPFAVWIPFSLVWIALLYRARTSSTSFNWRPGAAAGLVIAVTVLNGFTPYTEIKTAYGFNMYANLLTADGESNHFLIRRTLPLRSGYNDPVEIISTSDAGLRVYAIEGYLIAQPELRRYLAHHPETSVAFRVGNSVVTLDRASESPAYSDPGPWWWRFFPLRALDSRVPPRCQDAFLPAL